MNISSAHGGTSLVQVIQSVSGSAGGPPLCIAQMNSALVARGMRVSLWTEDPDTADAVTKETQHLTIHEIVPPGWSECWRRGPARRQLARLLHTADMVYLHGVWDPLLLAAATEARAAGIPYVVHPHGMLDPWSLAQKRWKKRLALALVVRRLLNGASAIRALNRAEAELMEPLKLTAPLRVIPNGVDLAALNPAPVADLFAKLPLLGGKPYILFLSRLHYKKGLDYLADAFARVASQFPEVQLLVAGADQGGQHAFAQRVARLGLTARVHLPGPLYGPLKWAALANCACFCLPSRQEGFSLAILEALASRAPVVISQECHFPEVAAAGAGLVTALTAEAVAAGLQRVLGDPGAAATMGVAGRRLVQERYTWTTVAASCDQMNRDILAGSRPEDPDPRRDYRRTCESGVR